jgi:ABC-2 type transport system ATP-binding protein
VNADAAEPLPPPPPPPPGIAVVAQADGQGDAAPPTGTSPAPPPGQLDPAFAPDATVVVSEVSVWFNQKVALTELSCSFGPGVTGLLGPNGAGKTTLMRALCGLLPVNRGLVRVHGRDPRTDREVQKSITLVPEDDAVPRALTARQLVRYTASLHGLRDRSAPDQCLATVGLLDVADRRVGGFSKGMRQRAKIAAALVTGPSVLVLDEPLNGADPVQRVALIDLFHALGGQGRTVVVSSHVLHEVERLAGRQIVIIRGRLAAAGEHRAIRDSLHDRPRSVLVRSPEPRRLAAELIALDVVQGVQLDGDGLVVSSQRAGDLAAALPVAARRVGASLREVRPLDDSLESVFRELLR